MSHNKITRRLAALTLAVGLMITSLGSMPVYAAASGTDTEQPVASTGDVSSGDALAVAPLGSVEAKASMLIDIGTGDILYEQNADESLPPASTTKIMTALLVMEAIERGELSLDEQITAEQTEIASIPWDASTINPAMTAGETMSVQDMLYGIMLSSDCAICNILAKRVSGSVDQFVQLMNTRAQELGCTGTNFLNTHGYPKDGHVTTARSLYLISAEAMKHPVFAEIVSKRSYLIPATNKAAERKLTNSNALMLGSSDYSYQYATGVKTGYCKSAGLCLVSTAEQSGRKLMSVILGAEKLTGEGNKTIYKHFLESRRMLEWGFNAFAWQTIATEGFSAAQIPLAEGESDHLTLVYTKSAVALLPLDFDMSTLDYKVNLRFTSATAPVLKGEIFGNVQIFRGEKLLADIPIVAGADAPVKQIMSPTVMYIVIGGALLAFVLMVMAIRQAKSRKGGYGYDTVSYDPASDPSTYRYGERPLYSRRGRGYQVSRPTYTDGGGYYTRAQADENEQYYEEYRRERELNRYRDREYYEESRSRPTEPVFPRNWTPPERRR